MELNKVYLGDALETIKTFPDESIDCVVTSPPYYALRDYGIDGQIGLEETPEAYIQKLVDLFREIRRVLKDDGTIWVNIGDSYNGYKANANASTFDSPFVGGDMAGAHPARKSGFGLEANNLKPKDLIGIPWMLAFALRADGWYLRQDIIWHKPNPMPESVTDRCTKSHEYIFLLSKSQKYYFDYEAIQEEAVTQIDPRIGNRVEYDGMRKGQEGTGNRAFVSLKVKEPRTKNCQYDGQRPNSFHIMREFGQEWQPQVKIKGHQMGGRKYGESDDPHHQTKSGKDYMPQMRWGSGTKKERTHEQGYSQAENGGHRDNSGGFDCEMSIRDGVVVRNKRDVWTVNVRPNKEAHFATYPQTLITPCILAGCKTGGVVLDPFMGSGTTGIVARKLNRNFVGCELNPEYQKMAERRIFNEGENLFNT